MIKQELSKFFLSGLLLATAVFYSATGFSALVGDAHWKVEKGDSVYSIARKVFPDDTGKQGQFRKALVESNPSVFKGNANLMSVGVDLVLPAFAVSKPVAIVKQEEAVIEVQPVLPVLEVEKIVEQKIITPDPEDVIGHVVISVGDMQANNRGVFRKLLRHSEVLKGDVLTTSKRAYTQIRMKDGALISLRPNTELKIINYHFNGKEDGSERSVMELVSGGFRTITGYIGHLNKQNYRVRTAVATIGIRGTHYGLMVCADGSCDDESATLEDGVYGGVVEGSIVVENEAGLSTFNNDQYFHIAAIDQAAVEQLVPPPVFHGKAEKQASTKGTGGEKKPVVEQRREVRGDRLGALLIADITERRPLPVLRDQVLDVIKDKPTVTLAPSGSGMLIAFSSLDPSISTVETIAAPIIVLDGNNNAIVLGSKVNADGFIIKNLPIAVHEESTDGVHGLALPSGVSGITDIGGNGIGVNWGRWTDNYVFTENGTPQQTFGDLHYIYSDNLTSPARLAALGGILGTQTYDFAGGTTPTGTLGQGTLSTLTMTADFTNGKVFYDVSGTGAGGTLFEMKGIDPVTSATAVEFENMADFRLQPITVCPSCVGSASAAFVGNNAEAAITTYSIQNDTGDGINGAAVLTR